MTRATTKQADPTAADRSIGFRSSNPEHRVEVHDDMDYAAFRVDPEMQRDIIQSEVRHIVNHFNPMALGVFTVSVRQVRRGNRTVEDWVLVDGQQRQEAMKQLQWPGGIRTIFHYGLTPAEEARLFLDLNERHIVGPADKYKNRLRAEEPRALAIQAMLSEFNIGLAGKGGFSAITKADKIFDSGPTGPADLRWALQFLKDTYGQYDGRVLEALAMLHREYGQYIDVESLRSKLMKTTPTISRLTGNGKVMQQVYHCTAAMGVAEALIATYNMYTRKEAEKSSALPSLINRRRKPRAADREELARVRDAVETGEAPEVRDDTEADLVLDDGYNVTRGGYSNELDDDLKVR